MHYSPQNYPPTMSSDKPESSLKNHIESLLNTLDHCATWNLAIKPKVLHSGLRGFARMHEHYSCKTRKAFTELQKFAVDYLNIVPTYKTPNIEVKEYSDIKAHLIDWNLGLDTYKHQFKIVAEAVCKTLEYTLARHIFDLIECFEKNILRLNIILKKLENTEYDRVFIAMIDCKLHEHFEKHDHDDFDI